MLATTIVCPHCNKALKATKPLAVGKRILCKQCGTTFRVSPTSISDHTPLPLTNSLTTPTALAAEPSVIEFDRGRLVKLALVALVLVGGLLLIGGGSALALVYAARKERTQTAEHPTTPPPVVERQLNRPGLNDSEESEATPPRADDPIVVPRLPPEEQAQVNTALEKGLAYLKRLPHLGNHQGHGVGHAALEGLTLLECGVSANEDTVKVRANYVRELVAHTLETYDISLAILFLDRLGEAADRASLRTLALRLIAGQQADGGWTYGCKQLSTDQEKELLLILEQTRPRNPLELFTDDQGRVRPEFVVPGNSAGQDAPFKATPRDQQTDPMRSNPGSRDGADQVKDLAKVLEKASRPLKDLPVLQPSSKPFIPHGGSDNSNTQFAVLAVWVASRQDIPVERTLALIVKRFRTSQDRRGRWGYYYQHLPAVAIGEPAMTCAGLLGLGAGYGLTASSPDKADKQPSVKDQLVMDGFKALRETIDKPLGLKGRGRRPVNLYLPWSVERVGVMYNVSNIGDKDWYQWGAELLVDTQNADGSWSNGGYPGANAAVTPRVDTCFALLFLQRANVAKDLSKKLKNLIDVKDLGSK